MLASFHGCPGDAPKVVVAPATIAECYHFTVLARQIAESFRTPVLVLTDANLATGVQPFTRPVLTREQMEAPFDQSPWEPGVAPYDWDSETGLSPRPIPGQKGGEYVLTGLAHTRWSKGRLRSRLEPNRVHDAKPEDSGASEHAPDLRRCTATTRVISWS